MVSLTFVALVIAISPAHNASATPDPTEPSTTEPSATEPPAEEPADTAPGGQSEADPEPGDVSPAVWVGVIVLVVAAIAFAVGRTTKTSRSPMSHD